MRKVKYALAFLTGAGYTSAWWCVLTLWDTQKVLLFIPLLIAVFGSVGLIIAVMISLAKHWKED